MLKRASYSNAVERIVSPHDPFVKFFDFPPIDLIDKPPLLISRHSAPFLYYLLTPPRTSDSSPTTARSTHTALVVYCAGTKPLSGVPISRAIILSNSPPPFAGFAAFIAGFTPAAGFTGLPCFTLSQFSIGGTSDDLRPLDPDSSPFGPPSPSPFSPPFFFFREGAGRPELGAPESGAPELGAPESGAPETGAPE